MQFNCTRFNLLNMKFFILITSLIICNNLRGQKESTNWFFGDSLLMTFTDTEIVCSKVPGFCQEASSSISSENGDLLFYIDGSHVWNKNFTKMNNTGIDFESYTEGAGSSTTQGILILPMPGDSLNYYIFHFGDTGLEYSIVDMSLDSGFGDITEKNVHIFEELQLMEKLTAVKHGNGRDWWVFVHQSIYSFDPELTNKFYELLVTPTGISGPFELNIGELLDFQTNWGEMVFSPDGSMLALTALNILELFEFDRCTGMLSEYTYIDNFDLISYSAYGCSFSPDGSKLYVSSAYTDILYQYCLNCNDTIEDTKTLIFENPYSNYFIGQHELGPDGKIYFALGYNTIPNNIFSTRNMNLCVIKNPNAEGLACDLDTSTIWLGNRRSTAGLPNMVNYTLGPLIGSECDTVVIDTTTNISLPELEDLLIYPNPATTQITIQSNNTEELIYTIKTIQGQVILSGSFMLEKSINIKDIAAGVYMVEIRNKIGSVLKAKQIVKN